MTSLRHQTARGSIAMALTIFGSRPIALLAMAILARLLDPADFGTVALAMVLFSTAMEFTSLGLADAMIQSDREPQEVAFQAFATQMAISFVFFAIIFLNPLFFAQILGNVRIVPVLRWLSLTLLLDTAVLVPAAFLRRELKFGQLGKATMLTNIFNNVVTIILAYMGFGLWSLVYGQLASATAKLVMIWWAAPGWSWVIPTRWDRLAMQELSRYGVSKTASGLMSFFNSNWDDWLVGRVLGPASLGFYDKAYGLTNGTIAGFNRSVINGVLFPSYSKIRNDKERLGRAYIKSLGLAALIMAPLSMGVFAVATELVPVMFGQKWLPMVPVLQIFSFMALFRPLAASTAPLFSSLGRPDLNFRVGVVITIFMVPMVYLLLDRGIVGVAIAVTVSYCIGFFYNVYQINRILPGVARQMLPAIAPSLIASASMIVAVQAVRYGFLKIFPEQHDVVLLFTMVGAGAVVYILTAYLLQREAIKEMANLLVSVFKGKGGRPALPGRRRLRRNPEGTG